MNKRVANEEKQAGDKHGNMFNLKNNGKGKFLKTCVITSFCLPNGPIPNKQTNKHSEGHTVKTVGQQLRKLSHPCKHPSPATWVALNNNALRKKKKEKHRNRANFNFMLIS